MTKQEHIDFWIKTANDDWEAVLSLYKSKKYVQALFFAHLTLEKWCKAHWVKDNDIKIPPRTHNLVKLLQGTQLEFSNEELMFLEEFNDFQIEGRYPDYMFEVYKRCGEENTKQLLEQVEKIIECLRERMQSKR